MRDIMIVGAGGWGREAAWTLERVNADRAEWNIIGYADDDSAKAGTSLEGYPILGTPEKVSADHPGAAVLIAVGDNEAREKIYRRLRGHDFPAIVDPAAIVAPTAEMRHGCFIGPLAVISSGVELGKFVIVNARAGVGHDAKMADFSQVPPGLTVPSHGDVPAHALFA